MKGSSKAAARDDIVPLQHHDPKSDDGKGVFLPEEEEKPHTWQQRLAEKLKIHNEYVRIALAEYLGTFVLVVIGVGCNAQNKLDKSGGTVASMFAWGIGVAMGVYTCGGVSGGHINPAVTTAMVLLGRLPLIKMPFYLIGQYAGALVGSLAVYVVYIDGLKKIDGGFKITPGMGNATNTSSADIWSTFLNVKDEITVAEGFADQVFATAMLVLLVMAITDERNMGTPKGMAPLVIGFAVAGLISGYAYNCGAALNPARDLGPRIFTAIAGWEAAPFKFHGFNWFWVPIVGPHVGAVVGALFYNICVGLHWPEPESKGTK